MASGFFGNYFGSFFGQFFGRAIGGGFVPGTPITSLIVGADPASSYQTTFAYKTDVQESADGSERRFALVNNPREIISATYKLDAPGSYALRARLAAGLAATVLLVDEPEGLLATADITNQFASVDTTRSDVFAVGLPVLVSNGCGDSYTANITAMSPGTPGANTLTLDQLPTAGKTFAAGAAYVLPLRPVNLQDNPDHDRYTLGDGVLTVNGQAATVRTTWGTGASLTTFDSFPVLNKRIILATTFKEQVRDDLQLIDYGAAFGVVSERTAGAVRRMHQWTVTGDTDRQFWKLLLSTLRGRQGAMLVPTWLDDLVINTQPTVGATSLLIKSTPNYVTSWFAMGIKHLQLEHADGTVEYAKVTAAVDNGNGTQTLTVAVGVSGTAITRISLLELCRLDSDDATLAWGSGLVGSIALSLLNVSGVSVDQPAELYDFTTPTVTYRYTSAEAPIVYSGHTYTPAPIKRSALVMGGSGESPEFSFETSPTLQFVVDQRTTIPSQGIYVVVRSFDRGTLVASTICSRRVSAIRRQRNGDTITAVIVTKSVLDRALAKKLPLLIFQTNCNNNLYDAVCGVSRASYKTTTTVAAVDPTDGRLVTVVSDGGHSGDYFLGGEMVHVTSGERRTIINRTNGTPLQLMVSAPFPAIAATDSIELYAGCQKRPATDCRDKFNRMEAYTGFPYIPNIKPYRDGGFN